MVTFTVDRSRATAGLCLEQHHEEEKQQLESRAVAKPPPRTHGNGSASSRRIATQQPGASSLTTVAGRASASQVPNTLENERTRRDHRSVQRPGTENVGSAWESVIYPLLRRHHAGENRRRAASVVPASSRCSSYSPGPIGTAAPEWGPAFPPRRFSRRENWVPGGAAG